MLKHGAISRRVLRSKGPKDPRSHGLKDQDISKSYSNTSLTLKKVHLVYFVIKLDKEIGISNSISLLRWCIHIHCSQKLLLYCRMDLRRGFIYAFPQMKIHIIFFQLIECPFRKFPWKNNMTLIFIILIISTYLKAEFPRNGFIWNEVSKIAFKIKNPEEQSLFPPRYLCRIIRKRMPKILIVTFPIVIKLRKLPTLISFILSWIELLESFCFV